MFYQVIFIYATVLIILLFILTVALCCVVKRRKKREFAPSAPIELREMPALQTWKRMQSVKMGVTKNNKIYPSLYDTTKRVSNTPTDAARMQPFSYLHFSSPHSINSGLSTTTDSGIGLCSVMEGCRTPCNSLYEELPSSARKQPPYVKCKSPCEPLSNGRLSKRDTFECEELVCCTHGVQCDQTDPRKSAEDDEDNYVDLIKVSLSHKERQALIDNIKQELEFSDFFSNKRNGKRLSKTKKANNKLPMDDDIFLLKEKPKKRGNHKSSKMQAQDSLETAATIAAQQRNTTNSSHNKVYYIGTCTFSESEQSLEKNGDFRLYYRLPTAGEIDDLNEKSLLYMVYKFGPDEYRHYQVRQRRSPKEIYVDYGDPRAQGFVDLNELIDAFKKKIRLTQRLFPVAIQQST